ncbi:type II 3-dehydroquinate dehydratase [Acholeplasma hippikon]|uniref:3-dehydroquinate dehydratase n=1 Tax=Acholeplasma hippikon TaxID=264636 RepID=A0A449BJF1_9MOLU|nr:type II 3-dehydroquinate dehydratase [Acholeplasma hippikon]VEU82568.1 3-dehydroquinate dehydratase [Acholeplasma hippikon]
MKIAIVNGPNLNMLGKRNKDHYGTLTLDSINQLLVDTFKEHEFTFFQSNHEGALVDYIQTLDCDGLVINAAAYTHTSVAIRDALEIHSFLKVEVHLSDINNREDFRKTNFIKDVVNCSFFGKKEQSYIDAVNYLVEKNKFLK